jgi:hypothetical protein
MVVEVLFLFFLIFINVFFKESIYQICNRYHCEVCADFDFCEECQNKFTSLNPPPVNEGVTHIPSHKMTFFESLLSKKLSSENLMSLNKHQNNSSVETHFACDNCGQGIYPSSLRYHCTICKDIDLCQNCFWENNENTSSFDKIRNHNSEHIVEEYNPSESNEPNQIKTLLNISSLTSSSIFHTFISPLYFQMIGHSNTAFGIEITKNVFLFVN